ncbi:MAG: hypothetical protein QNK33_05615, partial [Bacteroidales bacterium]|nr:hypothetical protein [Bacteroidales bacterium]
DEANARKYLQQAKIVLSKKNATPQEKSFYSLFAAGIEMSKNDYEKALEILKEGPNNNFLIIRYYKALLNDKLGNTEEAVTNYSRVVKSTGLYFKLWYYARAKEKIKKLSE